MLTRVFARALAPEVRVCGIAPGTVAAEPGQEERRAAESLLGRDRLPGGRRERRRVPPRSRVRDRVRRWSSTAAGSSSRQEPRPVEFRTGPLYGCFHLCDRARRDPHRADRARRSGRVRGALPAFRAASPRDGAPPARRPWPGRGGGAGDLRCHLALGAQLPPGARHRLGLALRGRHDTPSSTAQGSGSSPRSTCPEQTAVEDGPAELAELTWLAWRVHTAVERLPERERSVLELAYWSGLSQSEIASYLDVPLGTVKTRTRAGLARLSTLLEEVQG